MSLAQVRLALVMLLLAVTTSCSGPNGQALGEAPDESSAEPTGSATKSGAAETAIDWPEFRGPSRMGTSPATGLPLSWDETKNIEWTADLPGSGASTPIVVGDRIYLTSYTGYFVPGESGGSLDELTRHLLCLSRKDGSEIWRRSVKAALPEEERIRDHGYAANSVAADEDHVYAFLGKSGVYAYDHDGELAWRADVGSGTSGWGTAASPVLHGDLVYINASVESQSLIALDKRTGDEKWRIGGVKESWNTPVIATTSDNKEELVLGVIGEIWGLDPASGEKLWTCDTDINWYMVPSGVAANGVVYYLGGRSGVAALAVRAGGRGDVTSTHRLWTSNKGSNVTSPVYRDGHLYWMHEKLGIAYCAKADTGELVYEERLNRAGQVYASSILADGRIYYINRSGRTFVVAAKTEFELLSTNDLPRDRKLYDASPAVAGDQLFIRSGGTLFCIAD